MGLWLANHTVKKHGGSISVGKQMDGLGMVITIRLPAFFRTAAPAAVVASRQGEEERGQEQGEEHSASMMRQSPPLSLVSPPEDSPAFQSFGSATIAPNVKISSHDDRLLKLADLRLLIVDDSSACRKVLKEMIRRILKNSFAKFDRLNLHIVDADDGTSGLAALKVSQESEEPFDIVFLDNIMTGKRAFLSLLLPHIFGSSLFYLNEHIFLSFLVPPIPDMHGPEAARGMRALGYQNLIVGVTGNLSNFDIDDFLKAGVDKVLGKPLQREAFAKIVLEAAEAIVSSN